jgi:phenylalanine-4-hydroxylase
MSSHAHSHSHSHTDDTLTVADAADFRTHQDWGAYSPTDHAVWRVLFERRLPTLRKTASRIFLEGLELTGIHSDSVPNLASVNARLRGLTGWQAVPVTGFLPAKSFFASLGRREFPTAITLRAPAELDYVEAPDIFHDVFGHVPLHAHPRFASFLSRFGALAARAEADEIVEQLARLFWFTVEFGLVREQGEVKVYGSGLISSHADAANALGPNCERRPFELDAVLNQSFEIDHLQNLLFVVEDFAQLDVALDVLEEQQT